MHRLRGGLIVSVQATAPSLLDDPYVLAAMAAEAERAGAVGLRLQGVVNISAARRRTTIPMIGIIKAHHPGFEPYITSTRPEVEALLATGVEIIAFDCTGRPRFDRFSDEAVIATIHAGGAIAMADCATIEDAYRAAVCGADIVATTLCGFTKETQVTALPSLGLVEAMVETGAFVICEGGIHRPAQAEAALAAGADAVVVGTAITDLGWLVGEFRNHLAKESVD